MLKLRVDSEHLAGGHKARPYNNEERKPARTLPIGLFQPAAMFYSGAQAHYPACWLKITIVGFAEQGRSSRMRCFRGSRCH